MLSDAYEKELKKFDAERVLVAWDGLVTKQQATLESLQVPTMFKTDITTDREVRNVIGFTSTYDNLGTETTKGDSSLGRDRKFLGTLPLMFYERHPILSGKSATTFP